ncbi:glycosyltransferase family 4 protein [Alicyclobacillus fastidiosus]|uniref:Glycosyltransferase family 4 protein n=1 Tax=Alicyclobacillus fastidiosus TaxID=392011 RepID=A0ABV5ADE4_9BACL|nr:glycosyltransferase family 4 protein [Alicyclobacillus fastidiosus]WEH10371.1 glycosyltransferase family 4 protein [Alicyclobacillus fastidiosus]
MDKAKRVVIVAYLFPPIGGIGVQRALKFAKYLVDHGWEPIVLTTDLAVSATMDEALLAEIPPQVQVVRVRDPLARLTQRVMRSVGAGGSADATAMSAQSDLVHTGGLRSRLKRWLKRFKDVLLIPDEQILWAIRAAVVGATVIRSQKVSCVFTTSSPVSAHLTGWLLRRWTRVPWVADFRDPWTDNMHFQGSGRRAGIERRLERSVMREATAITTVTDGFALRFAQKYPFVANKTTVIRNGVDPADFAPLDRAPASGKFTMLYAGILYPKRSPAVFLKALSQAIRSGRIRSDDIRVEFAGVFDYPGSSTNRELVERLHLDKVVKVLGYLSHDEVVRRMENAHSLLLIGDNDPTAHQYIPGKLYEYLYTRRPIFALLKQGEASSLIEHHEAGIVVPPDEVSAVEDAIVKMVQQFRTQGPAAANRPVPKSLTRPFQAGQLAQLMDELTYSQPRAIRAQTAEWPPV